jgi:hypothetical protein
MTQMNRRDFIGAAAGGTVALNSLLVGTSGAAQPKLKLGLIGCGNYA